MKMKLIAVFVLFAGALALPARVKDFNHDPEEDMDAVKRL